MSLPAADLVSVLTGRGQTVACAESLTSGLVCAALTDVPGASAVVRGAVVSYATDVKAAVLGVDADLLARAGAVDAEVARQMAQGVCRVLGSDWGGGHDRGRGAGPPGRGCRGDGVRGRRRSRGKPGG